MNVHPLCREVNTGEGGRVIVAQAEGEGRSKQRETKKRGGSLYPRHSSGCCRKNSPFLTALRGHATLTET